MAKIIEYNRQEAVAYANRWALSRNPRYADYSKFGGDCTNFVSQCLFAGSGVMNYTPVYGWYYSNGSNHSASWSGVEYLKNFMVSNKKQGVFATETDISRMQLGDAIQLGDESGHFYHSLVVTKINGAPSLNTIYVSTHTFDALSRPLNTYVYGKIRFLHIQGVYKSW